MADHTDICSKRPNRFAVDDANRTGPPTMPRSRHRPWQKSRPIEQVAQQHVIHPGRDTRSEEERPIVESDQRPSGDNERGGVPSGLGRELMSQRDDRQERNDAGNDDRRFNDSARDIAEGQALVLPLEKGEQRDAGADARDHQDDFEECAEENPESAPPLMT